MNRKQRRIAEAQGRILTTGLSGQKSVPAGAYLKRGSALYDAKQYGEAVASYNQAIAASPRCAEAYNNRGLAFYHLKQHDEALASYDKAVAINPDYADAYYNRGLALHSLKQYDEALANYNKAIALKPDYAEAYNNRGFALHNLKRYDEALKNYDKAIAIRPTAKAYNNRGLTLHNLTRYDDAVENYTKAIALAPRYADIYSNLGLSLHNLKRFGDALTNYDKAIAIDPGYADAYWNKALSKLLLGEYEEGWKLYEWRWKKTGNEQNKAFQQPAWLGRESLADRTILLHQEQGWGDAIQLCRYVSLVEALGAKVIVKVRSPLAGLISTLKGTFHTVTEKSFTPNFDLHCPLMSLPLAFGTTVGTIPAGIPYLSADPHKRKTWQERLGNKTRPRIGLVWSGAADHTNDHNRSIALGLLSPLLQGDFDFHSLQQETRSSDQEVFAASTIIPHADDLKDFTDTAALIAEMDLIISVDTSAAHLAGALGKPVWILLPFVPDFRWMLEREDSPWYPTARLFRQPNIGDWKSVIEKMKAELALSKI